MQPLTLIYEESYNFSLDVAVCSFRHIVFPDILQLDYLSAC